MVQRITGVLPMFRDNFTSDDVRRAIKSVLNEANAVPIGGRGANSCFAPAYSESTLEALGRAVAGITDRAGATEGQTFIAAPVPEGEEWQQACENAGRQEFGSRIETIETEMADYHCRVQAHLDAVAEAEAKGETCSATGPRVAPLASRLNEYKDLRDKIESYAGALSFTADDLLQKLDAVRGTIEELIGA